MTHHARVGGRDETLERVRRIETRLTKLLNHFGLNPGVEKPRWEDPDIIRLPSRKTPLDTILDVVPVNYGKEEFDLYIGSDYVATMFIDK
jgi:hypothetical protein